MIQSLKRLLSYILLFIMALVFFVLFYVSKTDKSTLNDFYNVEGEVSVIKISQIDGARTKLDVLFINLKNDKRDFIYLKKNQNYIDFLNVLKKGDFVNLHFKEDFGKNRFEIIQLEKDSNTLISFESNKKWSTKMGYFFLFASIMTIIYSIQSGRKYWN
ncbi:hypothetical protein AB3G34_14690 [Flavobacterium sp. WC2409]|uniref:DUF3592 domain-containing protein n=1 Tax=Flavobacterium sp. WC2409 TaxID=3234139 RepID=A0AB39VZY5_9FLAO